MKWSNTEREMTADKTSPASNPPAKKIDKKKRIIIKINHLTNSFYSHVVRNSFSGLIAGLFQIDLGRVKNREEVWVGKKIGGRFGWVENRREVWVG